MKKVFQSPHVLFLLGTIILLGGILIGKKAQNTVVKLTVNEETGRTYQEEYDETAPDDHLTNGKIDINTATVDILVMLPGIGEVTANRIVTYREEHGPYKSIEDLLNVEGIGEGKLKDIENYITVN